MAGRNGDATMDEKSGDEQRAASPDARHWMAATRQVQQLALRVQQVRDGGPPSEE